MRRIFGLVDSNGSQKSLKNGVNFINWIGVFSLSAFMQNQQILSLQSSVLLWKALLCSPGLPNPFALTVSCTIRSSPSYNLTRVLPSERMFPQHPFSSSFTCFRRHAGKSEGKSQQKVRRQSLTDGFAFIAHYCE